MQGGVWDKCNEEEKDFEFGSGQPDFKCLRDTQRKCQKGRILAVHAGFAYLFSCLFVFNI